jgi:hypothetical protein
MLVIHTFGDSHSRFGWESISHPKIKIHHHTRGAILMHSFGRDPFAKFNLTDPCWNVKEGQVICFCFGEIDCRRHIHKHANKDYKEVIDKLIEPYFKAIAAQVTQFQNLTTCVYNIIPPMKGGSMHSQRGPLNKRKEYAIYLNQLLAKKCAEVGYLFVDVYNSYAKNGLLNKKLSDGDIHIKNPVYLTAFLEKHLLANVDHQSSGKSLVPHPESNVQIHSS